MTTITLPPEAPKWHLVGATSASAYLPCSTGLCRIGDSANGEQTFEDWYVRYDPLKAAVYHFEFSPIHGQGVPPLHYDFPTHYGQPAEQAPEPRTVWMMVAGAALILVSWTKKVLARN